MEVSYYRPQRSCGKVMFLYLCVIMFTGGSSVQGRSLSRRGVSVQKGGLCPGGSLSGTPPYGNIKLVCILMECILVKLQMQMKLQNGYVFTPVCQSFCSQGGSAQCMVGYTPLGRHPPRADGYCCGRYASYWNAFLLPERYWSIHESVKHTMANTHLQHTHTPLAAGRSLVV